MNTNSAGRTLLDNFDGEQRISIAIEREVAVNLLEDNGWIVELIADKRGPSFCFVKPGCTPRADGGRFGVDYLWNLDEAVAAQITATATALA